MSDKREKSKPLTNRKVKQMTILANYETINRSVKNIDIIFTIKFGYSYCLKFVIIEVRKV